MLQVHVRVIYHVGAKPFFTAIGEEDNRNRRWRRPYPIKLKLMGLDFVLAHRQHHYLATEGEKLDYFVGTLGLNRSFLPQRVYRSRYRQVSAVSPGASRAPSPVVGLCYVDGSIGKPSGSDTYLAQYKDLFSRLERFGIIYIAGDERMFPKAERIFGRLCGNGPRAVYVPRDREIERLREHFRARDLFERRETSSFGKAGLDRLREELTEFGGPNMKPCNGNGENAVSAFRVGAQKFWKGGQEALRHTGSITITSCPASSAGRYRHETNLECRGPWRRTS